MFGDYQQWLRETGALYDQIVANFYRALTERDKAFLKACRVGLFGDNRPAYRKDL
jgi:hypothetical protein